MLAAHPRLQRVHSQNRQRYESNALIGNRQPSQNSQGNVRSQRDIQTIHTSLWCTGKDSNLRTSKEGQIYSLLALTTHPPVRKTEFRFRHHSGFNSVSGYCRLYAWTHRITRAASMKKEEQTCARSTRARTPHLESIPMECCWKKSVTTPRCA